MQIGWNVFDSLGIDNFLLDPSDQNKTGVYAVAHLNSICFYLKNDWQIFYSFSSVGMYLCVVMENIMMENYKQLKQIKQSKNIWNKI